MKPIHVGLLGIGTVGGGTFEVLRRNQEMSLDIMVGKRRPRPRADEQ